MITLDTARFQSFVSEDADGPVVMLNLLRFRPDHGRETYLSYLEHFATTGVQARYGVEVLYAGSGGVALAAEPGQHWDMVALVRYPNRQAFIDMVNDGDYQRFEHLRTQALVESVLQATVPLSERPAAQAPPSCGGPDR